MSGWFIFFKTSCCMNGKFKGNYLWKMILLVLYLQALKSDLVAQLVEHLPFKERVLGSSPSQVTILAHVAELVDALGWGPSGKYPLEVRVLSCALIYFEKKSLHYWFRVLLPISSLLSCKIWFWCFNLWEKWQFWW